MKEIAGSAELGFGAGQSTMDLYVTLTDLSQPEKPLYTVGKHDDSGNRVGAVVTMNPYVAVAKFGEVFEGIRDAGHSGISQNEAIFTRCQLGVLDSYKSADGRAATGAAWLNGKR